MKCSPKQNEEDDGEGRQNDQSTAHSDYDVLLLGLEAELVSEATGRSVSRVAREPAERGEAVIELTEDLWVTFHGFINAPSFPLMSLFCCSFETRLRIEKMREMK